MDWLYDTVWATIVVWAFTFIVRGHSMEWWAPAAILTAFVVFFVGCYIIHFFTGRK